MAIVVRQPCQAIAEMKRDERKYEGGKTPSFIKKAATDGDATRGHVSVAKLNGCADRCDHADGTKRQKRKGKMIDAAKLGSGNEMSARDFDVLEHLARYHVGTMQSLKNTVFLGKSINVVGKVTRRLVRQGWLTQHQAGPFFFVYTLSRKTCCLMDLLVPRLDNFFDRK